MNDNQVKFYTNKLVSNPQSDVKQLQDRLKHGRPKFNR